MGRAFYFGGLPKSQNWSAEWLERAMRLPLKLTHIGYAPISDGLLWELHFLAMVSLIAFVLLYLFLYPIVAPVVTTTKPMAEIVFAAAIFFCILLLSRRTGSKWNMEKAGVLFSLVFLALLSSFVYFLRSDLHNHTVKLGRSFFLVEPVDQMFAYLPALTSEKNQNLAVSVSGIPEPGSLTLPQHT